MIIIIIYNNNININKNNIHPLSLRQKIKQA